MKKNSENLDNKKDKRDKIINTIKPTIFIIIGIMNIIYASTLKTILPTILGFATIITSSISLINNIIEKEYKTLDTMKIPSNAVYIIVGLTILFKGENAIPFIAIVWGMSGLRKGTKELNVAIYNKVHKNRFLGELIHSIFELTISILLIYNPFTKLEEHLILLGIEMIIGSSKVLFKDKNYNDIED